MNTDKEKIMMNEQVSKIKEGKLSLESAEQQILDLFAVSGMLNYQCQYCGTKKHSKHGICEKCGRF